MSEFWITVRYWLFVEKNKIRIEAFVNSRGVEAIFSEHELFDSAEGLVLHYVE
jgi:hypothetical protein